MSSPKPLLTVFNTHAASCGEPPDETNELSGRYVGYFQNEHGDQWLFMSDPETGTATLRSGDAGWDTTYTLRGPEDLPASMTDSERAWVLACLQAAHKPDGFF
jgi:hypothetical protein